MTKSQKDWERIHLFTEIKETGQIIRAAERQLKRLPWKEVINPTEGEDLKTIAKLLHTTEPPTTHAELEGTLRGYKASYAELRAEAAKLQAQREKRRGGLLCNWLYRWRRRRRRKAHYQSRHPPRRPRRDWYPATPHAAGPHPGRSRHPRSSRLTNP